MIKGIDISNHQPSVDFNSLKNSVQVVIMKATEGVTYKDPLLESHYQKAKAAGFPVGFYHFMSEGSSPSEQAVAFYNAIKDKQYEILPCLDIETNNQNRSESQITDRCLEFLNKFKELSGRDCMIYTGGYFGRDNLDNRIKAYKAWIAHYGVNTPMATGFSNVVGHQYTESGRVQGINGNVDLNNFTEGIYINGQQSTEEQPREKAVWEYYINGLIIKSFQHELNIQFSRSLDEDGYYGTLSIEATDGITVRRGAKGKITRIIQARLAELGYYKGKIDEDFGGLTESAVEQLQKDRGIEADKVVGKETFREIFKK